MAHPAFETGDERVDLILPHSMPLFRVLDCVREAFYVARTERKPVVLSVPLDLQKGEFSYLPDYMPSTDLMPRRHARRWRAQAAPGRWTGCTTTRPTARS